jgi:beta-N-acetylhexosaminidase
MTVGPRRGKLVRRSPSWVRNLVALAAVLLVAGCAAAGSAQSSPAGRPYRLAAPGGAMMHVGANAGGGANSAAPAGAGRAASRRTTAHRPAASWHENAGPAARQAAAGGPAAGRPPASRNAAMLTSTRPPPAALPAMSARQLAGQRIIYSYRGLTPPARLLRRIRHGQAAGVIFFSGNIASKAQIRSVAAELQRAAQSKLNPVREPLLLMTDQEGGVVRRLPGAPALSEKQIGESATPGAQAQRAGRGAGRNLHSVGMNVNLAPVLDVFRRAGNFIDEFGRSYSMDPNVVSALGADFITAQQKKGVAATGKHFPGLGAARRRQNTDLRPVTLHLSAHSIQTIDELPYQAAITAGVKLVMVSWAAYPALGSHRPAGLSSKIVQGELRQRLGFSGVTITDALGAGALEHYGSIRNRSVLAATAGMDLLLCAGQRTGEGIHALNGLAGGYIAGTLNHADFRAAVRRVIALRASPGG